MQFIEFFANNLTYFIVCSTIFGLFIGSFLNVVIYRLPIMLERSWQSECKELLGLVETSNNSESFNLVVPRSRCPSCNALIRSIENIPVLSYLIQGGKCKNCGARISLQYPLIEIASAILSGIAAYSFGFGWQAITAMLLIWALISLAMIDFKTTLLPDNITLPFLWLGIIVNYFEIFCTLEESVLGAIFGYLSLWVVFQIFKLITGKEGMGYGDFKLLALLGAWLGWQFLLPIILISSIVGSIIGVAMIVTKLLKRDMPTPFGPYLALGGMICLLWGTEVQKILPL